MGCRNPSLAPIKYADILKRLKRCVLKTRRGVKACGGSNPPIRVASQRSLHVAMLFSLILYICSVRQVVKSQDFHSWITRSIRVRSTTHPESCFVWGNGPYITWDSFKANNSDYRLARGGRYINWPHLKVVPYNKTEVATNHWRLLDYICLYSLTG